MFTDARSQISDSIETIEYADEQSHSSALADCIFERKRNKITKGTRQIYDCHLKGFLQFFIDEGYTSVHHTTPHSEQPINCSSQPNTSLIFKFAQLHALIV